MHLAFDPIGGINFGRAAFKLFAGGADGNVHQYSYDIDSGSWYPYATQNFTNTWAYGGIAALSHETGQTDHYFIPLGQPLDNLSLIMTDRSGGVRSYLQLNGADNSSSWPTGASWSQPVDSNQKTAVNSSLSFSYMFDDTGSSTDALVVYPSADADHRMVGINVTAGDSPTLGDFGNSSSSALMNKVVMQGSAFTNALVETSAGYATVVSVDIKNGQMKTDRDK